MCNSQQILTLCDLLAEQDFRQLADVDTPSGNFETQEVLSSSAVEVDVSAMNISDVSAIALAERRPGALSTSQALTYKCNECDMICRNSSALQKHQVIAAILSLDNLAIMFCFRGVKTAEKSKGRTQHQWRTENSLSAAGISAPHRLLLHKSLNLVLSVTSSPLSQSLPSEILTPSNNLISANLEVPSHLPNTNATSAQINSVFSVGAPPGVDATAFLTPHVVSALPGAAALGVIVPPQGASTSTGTMAAPAVNAVPLVSSAPHSNSTLSQTSSQTEPSQTPFTCDICGKSLKTKSALIRHRVC